jgi:hypothetical protein
MTAYTIWQDDQPVARCDDATDAAHCLSQALKNGPAQMRAGKHAGGRLVAPLAPERQRVGSNDARQAAWEARMEASPAVTRAAND